MAYPHIAQSPEHFLFFNTKTHDYMQPIKSGQAWKFIRAICREIGLPSSSQCGHGPADPSCGMGSAAAIDGVNIHAVIV